MWNSSGIIFLIIGILALAVIAIVIVGIVLYNRYINKRLKGDTERKKFFNYKVFALVMASVLCFFMIGYLGISLGFMTTEWRNQQEQLNEYQDNPPKWSYQIQDFEKSPQYVNFRDEIISGDMTGFEIKVATDDDFECYFALTTQRVDGLPYLLPEYYIYIRYIGAEADDIQMERNYYYDQAHTAGNGGAGQYYNELLIVGNFGKADYYFGRLDYYMEIETILKIAPQTHESKLNWDNLPAHAQSNFVISNNVLTTK